MAHIVEFTIKGLAGRTEPLYRALDPHVNIFWGLNGRGKTSLLRILDSALQNDSGTIFNVPFTSAEILIEVPEHGATIRRTVSIEDINKETDVPYPPGLRYEFGDDSPIAFGRAPQNAWKTKILASSRESERTKIRLLGKLGYTYLPISRRRQSKNSQRYDRLLRNSGSDLITEIDFNRFFAQQIKAVWEDFHQNTLRTIRQIQQKGLALILSELFEGVAGDKSPELSDRDLRVEHQLVVDYLKEQNIPIKFSLDTFNSRYSQDSYLRRVVNDIQEIKNEIDATLGPEREFRDVLQSMFRENKRFIVDDGSGPSGNDIRVEIDGSNIPLESLSSGEQQLIHLLLETLAAADSTIMIDEPEISMHVDWQQRLVSSMRRINPNCQILLATHSPEIMANIDNEFIFQL